MSTVIHPQPFLVCHVGSSTLSELVQCHALRIVRREYNLHSYSEAHLACDPNSRPPMFRPILTQWQGLSCRECLRRIRDARCAAKLALEGVEADEQILEFIRECGDDPRNGHALRVLADWLEDRGIPAANELRRQADIIDDSNAMPWRGAALYRTNIQADGETRDRTFAGLCRDFFGTRGYAESPPELVLIPNGAPIEECYERCRSWLSGAMRPTGKPRPVSDPTPPNFERSRYHESLTVRQLLDAFPPVDSTNAT